MIPGRGSQAPSPSRYGMVAQPLSPRSWVTGPKLLGNFDRPGRPAQKVVVKIQFVTSTRWFLYYVYIYI